MVTIFTSTYNRSYILPSLYKSLCNQTSKDFEWVVVDDGSTDETETLIKEWLVEKLVDIKYIKQENHGKSYSINVGVNNAKGSLFFIVDSDDFLVNNAIETILEDKQKLKYVNPQNKICGICYSRVNFETNESISIFNSAAPKIVSSLDMTFKYGFKGDKAEVFFTDVLKKFPFPILKNNKFIPEALVWYRIANDGYKFLLNNTGIYMCNYINDGYSKNFKSNLKNNPKGFALFYKECLLYKETTFFYRIVCCIRYLQCLIYYLLKK